MNFFDQHPVFVTKIIAAQKHIYPKGWGVNSGIYRGFWEGLKKGFFSVSVTIDGEAEYIFDDRVITLRKNSILFLDNYTPFRFELKKSDHAFYVINFEAESGFIQQPQCFIPSDPERYVSMFKEASVHFKNKTPGYEMMTTSVLMKILSNIKKDHFQDEHPNSKTDKVVYAIDYIKNNLTNPEMSVKSIADMLDVSTVYLRKIFTEKCGVSPIKYIKNLRIGQATDMLGTEQYSIVEIAEKCGFANSSYFCREFRVLLRCSSKIKIICPRNIRLVQ